MEIKATSSSFRCAPGNPRQIREEYYERHFGPMADQIAHSTDQQPIHIDIYQFEPNGLRPHWTLITGGMSDLPQNVPPSAEGILAPRAELLMYAGAPQRWMLEILKMLAEFPFRGKTYLHWYHTWTSSGHAAPLPSRFSSCLFLPPCLENPPLSELQIEGDKVDFLWVVPITERERDYAVRCGGEALEQVLFAAPADFSIDGGRESVV